MTHYVDKDALVEEIERRRDAALTRQKNLESIGQETILNEMVANELNRIISFIDTLEVKEMDIEQLNKLLNWWKEVTTEHSVYKVKEVDLEMEIESYWKQCDIAWCRDAYNMTHIRSMLSDIAKHFFELGLKTQNGE